jgi:hypothetical protein
MIMSAAKAAQVERHRESIHTVFNNVFIIELLSILV